MNALEMLLQRVGAGGLQTDPDWLAHLADLGGGLPPQDEYIRSLGQGGINTFLHPNAAGIYAGADRPVPAGDEVLPASDDWWRRRGEVAANIVPKVSQQETRQWLNPNPDALPGPDGLLRISAGQSLARGLPRNAAPADMGEPSLDPRFRAQQQPLPSGLPLVVQDSIRNLPAYQEGGQVMAPKQFYAPNMGEEDYPREDPRRRDYRLQDLLGFGNFLRQEGGPAVPEGSFLTPLEPGQSPYATRLPSALNQLMRRLPMGQY